MVSYFLRRTLLKFFSSFPDKQSQQKVRQLGRITCAVIKKKDTHSLNMCVMKPATKRKTVIWIDNENGIVLRTVSSRCLGF